MSPLAPSHATASVKAAVAAGGTLSGPVDGVARGRRLQSGRPAVGTGSERPRPLKQTDRGVYLLKLPTRLAVAAGAHGM